MSGNWPSCYKCTPFSSSWIHTDCRVETVRLTSTAVVLLPVSMEELVKMSQMASTCVFVLLELLASTVKSSNAVYPLHATIKAPV